MLPPLSFFAPLTFELHMATSTQQDALLQNLAETIKQEASYAFSQIQPICVQITTILQNEHEGKYENKGIEHATTLMNAALKQLLGM